MADGPPEPVTHGMCARCEVVWHDELDRRKRAERENTMANSITVGARVAARSLADLDASTWTTRTVGGVQFTLTPGSRYVASRPGADHGRHVFPVTITHSPAGADVAVVEGLSYDAANELLAAFNNGRASWDGRVWA